ncbi:MAG: glycosyltransferase family 2 protein [Elusimicrobia bacterium]|nr:glycosyltransferase family 2 protein [Elusimicrobiota bacterium]
MSGLKFSILIPTYNRAHSLGQTIKSALAQDYPDFEVIVSDNASEDATRGVVAPFLSDPRFVYRRNETNIGLFPNWARLLYEHASGDYALFLPDDDCLINDSHLTDAAALIRRHDVNFVFVDAVFENQLSGITKRVNFDIPELLSVDWALENIGRRFQHNLAFSPGLASVFSVRRARELKGLFPHVCGAEGEMALRLMFDGPSAYLRNPQRLARGHKDSAGNTDRLESTLESLAIHSRMVEFGRARGYDRGALIRYKRRNVALWLGEIVLPIWLGRRDAGYTRLLAFLWHKRRPLGIDAVAFARIAISPQIIGKFVSRSHPRVFKALRQIYWMLRYRSLYPREFQTTVPA